MSKLLEELYSYQDLKYKSFNEKLIPTIDKDSIIGVRSPDIKNIAKRYKGSLEAKELVSKLPHKYYEENALHSCFISYTKDFDEAIYLLEEFLPYIDNWAICDSLKIKVLEKNKEKLLPYIDKWIKLDKTYTIRYGIGLLMSYYLDSDFKPEYLNKVAAIRSDEYYVNMMIAWYFATALAKQWDLTIRYFEEKKLEKWCHNKAIQKAVESYRITTEQKDYLRSLRIK